MVRFIICQPVAFNFFLRNFTFQYGQIYYTCKIQKKKTEKDFTFQYGQIYYTIKSDTNYT